MLGTINSALDLVEKARVAANAVRDADTLLVIADLKSAILDLKEEINQLREQNQQLQQRAKDSADSPFAVDADGVYHLKEPAGRAAGPYCPSCWEGSRRRTLLTKYVGGMLGVEFGKYQCTVCNWSKSS